MLVECLSDNLSGNVTWVVFPVDEECVFVGPLVLRGGVVLAGIYGSCSSFEYWFDVGRCISAVEQVCIEVCCYGYVVFFVAVL